MSFNIVPLDIISTLHNYTAAIYCILQQIYCIIGFRVDIMGYQRISYIISVFDIMNNQLRLLRVSIEMKERLTSALPQEIFSIDPSGDLEKLVTSPTEPDINCEQWQSLYRMETQQNTRNVSK